MSVVPKACFVLESWHDYVSFFFSLSWTNCICSFKCTWDAAGHAPLWRWLWRYMSWICLSTTTDLPVGVYRWLMIGLLEVLLDYCDTNLIPFLTRLNKSPQLTLRRCVTRFDSALENRQWEAKSYRGCWAHTRDRWWSFSHFEGVCWQLANSSTASLMFNQ